MTDPATPVKVTTGVWIGSFTSNVRVTVSPALATSFVPGSVALSESINTFVTVGDVVSYVTWLSVHVAAGFRLPAMSCATPALMLAMTVPSEVMPVTVTV